MSNTGNKRVSQLVEITATELASDDLLYVVDVTARESKRIPASELSLWFNVSGSSENTSSNSSTASYILGSNVDGNVDSSSYSLTSLSSSWSDKSSESLTSTSSSYSLTASYCSNNISSDTTTASYLSYTGNNNGTSSYSLNSGVSDVSKLSQFLSYSGTNNGTSSYSLISQTSSFSKKSIISDTASYFNNSLSVIASSSYSQNSDTASIIESGIVPSSSFLIYSPNNGTSSYAIVAGSISGVMNNYGIEKATTQSLSSSLIGNLVVSSSLGSEQLTNVESVGNLILYFTSSVDNHCTLSLISTNRFTGKDTTLDSSIVGLNTTPIMNTWGDLSTGSIYLPFHLLGSGEFYGEYLLSVSSSSPSLSIDPNKTVKFILSSKSDILYTQEDVENMEFIVEPDVTMSFSSSDGGPFEDNLEGVLSTGSQNITFIDISNKSLTDIRYTWKCNTLTYFDCSENLIENLRYGFPDTLETLICSTCSLNFISDLDNTSISTLNCGRNKLSQLPELSTSTSYLDCSYNNIPFFPELPDQLIAIYADSSSISSIPSLPVNLQTGSFSHNPLMSLPNPLPESMSYLDVSYTSMHTMSFMPVSMSYLKVDSSSFTTLALENITNDLLNNGQVTGTLSMRGYGSPSPTLLNNSLQLRLKSWSVSYDV